MQVVAMIGMGKQSDKAFQGLAGPKCAPTNIGKDPCKVHSVPRPPSHIAFEDDWESVK